MDKDPADGCTFPLLCICSPRHITGSRIPQDRHISGHPLYLQQNENVRAQNPALSDSSRVLRVCFRKEKRVIFPRSETSMGLRGVRTSIVCVDRWTPSRMLSERSTESWFFSKTSPLAHSIHLLQFAGITMNEHLHLLSVCVDDVAKITIVFSMQITFQRARSVTSGYCYRCTCST